MSFGDLRSAPDLLSRHLVRLVDSDCQAEGGDIWGRVMAIESVAKCAEMVG